MSVHFNRDRDCGYVQRMHLNAFILQAARGVCVFPPCKWFQRIIYSEVYFCTACGRRVGMHHRYLSVLVVNNFRFIFSRYSHCVSCGSGAIDRGGRVYFLSKNPLGWIQLLAAAPLRECSPCGRQYFDWRNPRPLRNHAAIPDNVSRDLAALSRAIPQTSLEHTPEEGLQDSERPFQNVNER